LDAQADLIDTQKQLSTGKRITKPSDDPVGSGQLLRLTEELDALNQFKRNNTLLTSELERSEIVVASMDQDIEQVRNINLQSVSGVNSASDLAALALQVEGLRDNLVGLANTRDSLGNYMFSGSLAEQPAIEFDDVGGQNKYQYKGDEDVNYIEVANDLTVQGVDNGKTLFQNIPTRLVTTENLTTNLITVDITDDSAFKSFYDTNFDSTSPANNEFTVEFDGTGNNISIIDPVTNTAIADQNGNTVLPYVSGQAINFNGMEINVEGTAGQQAIFTLEAKGLRNIIDVVDHMAAVMQDSSLTDAQRTAELGVSLNELSFGQEALLARRAGIGARLNSADRALTAVSERELSTTQEKADIGDIDFVATASKLAQQETALNAAFASFNRVTSLSLFDYL
jgi:flagellar hook-associated protein 3 FlgL